MQHAWSNYVQFAAGQDELRPITKTYKNWMANDGMAASAIDALDTLYIMGLTDEFNQARDIVFNTSFNKVPLLTLTVC